MKKFNSRMWLASFFGALAFIAGSGLTITSGWLITMASLQPPIMTLTVSTALIRFGSWILDSQRNALSNYSLITSCALGYSSLYKASLQEERRRYRSSRG